MNFDLLIEAATAARNHAYAPYSKFSVGAALLTTDETIFTGCNIENISYGLTICAERVALGSAIVAGHRTFVALALVADTDLPISPCGACRQAFAEFTPDLHVVLATLTGQKETLLLDQLLPRAKTGILNHE